LFGVPIFPTGTFDTARLEARMEEGYSQNGEDQALARIFGDRPGVCVEVGAHDGVTLSNTYYFERLGWRCVLVEPNPTLCKKIRTRRGERTILFECAASSADGTATLKMGSGADDVFSSIEAFEGVATDRRFVGIKVKTRTLDSMLEETGVSSIDFMSIDVEGHEMSALSGLDLPRWNPRIVLVEDIKDLKDDAVCKHMAKAGYVRFYRTGANDWYTRRGERRAMMLIRLLRYGRFSWRGLLKVSLPRWVIRPALNVHRLFLKS
jgi:FkbM family methyltransferase